ECVPPSHISSSIVNTYADLNDNIFPLNTDTYPQTRGIRVELATIIVIFILGIISQMKLWKVIKEKRAKRAQLQLRDERDLERLAEETGRRVEENNNRERAQWEAVYGDKDTELAMKENQAKADSGDG